MKLAKLPLMLAAAGIGALSPCAALDSQRESTGPLSGALSGAGASPPAFLLPFSRELAADIDEEGGRFSAYFEAGDLSIVGSLYSDTRVGIHRLYASHPAVSLGFIERGDLIRLLCSPGGQWSRVRAAALERAAEAKTGAPAPEEYGIVVRPFPGTLSVFSFYEPEIFCGGAHAGYGGDLMSAELLAVLSQPSAPYLPDGWLLERQPAADNTLVHGLFRLSVKPGVVGFSGGIALSASRHTAAQAAVSSTFDVDAPGFGFSATFSGATRGYFDIRGRPVGVPLSISYRLCAGESSPVTATLTHRVELETLPLVRIPFRAADESLQLDIELDAGPLSLALNGEARIKTARTALQELSAGTELRAALALPFGRIALSGRVFGGADRPLEWAVRLPLKLEGGTATLSTEAAMVVDEAARLLLSAELRGKTRSLSGWYMAVDVATELQTLRDMQKTAAKPARLERAGEFVLAGFGYRIGWRTKS
ncbi:MAG: hypothetical protein JW852_06650 [Spirochaetales bacterium]|nr:hypothetical protein [Spirochaetales bacterium]